MPQRFALVSLLIAFALAMGASLSADAQIQRRGVYGDWAVYTTKGPQGLVCYAETAASEKLPRKRSHGDVVFKVASWKSGAAREQVQLATNERLRIAAPGRATVGRTSFKLFSEGRDAFIDSMTDERKLVAEMRKGSDMLVTVMDEDGETLTYEFSLAGTTRALKEAAALCG
jgi:invasion protein IalB